MSGNHSKVIKLLKKMRIMTNGIIVYASLILFVAVAGSTFTLNAKAGLNYGKDSVRNIQVGDTISRELWSYPLKVVNHSEGKTEITLNEYREHDLIILDFWATWCSSCIKTLPHMYNIEYNMMGKVKLLSVTTQSREIISTFLDRTVLEEIVSIKERFTSVVEDEILQSFFPSRTIPHIVVLDKRGVVRAITVPSEIREDNLAELISNPQAKPITERVQFVDKPLLIGREDNINEVFYTAIIPYNAALPFTRRLSKEKGFLHFYMLNTHFVKLYAESISEDTLFKEHGGIHLVASRRVFELDSPKRLFDPRFSTDSPSESLFTYEQVTPLGTTISQVRRKMQLDLEVHFGLSARVEIMSIPCLVLIVDDKTKLPFASNTIPRKLVRSGITQSVGKFSQKDEPIRTRSSSYLQNYPLSQLAYMMNRIVVGQVPYVIDETGIEENLDLDIVDDLSDLEALNAMLMKQGLRLVEQRRELPMFVLSDPLFKRESKRLVLTEHGYIYGED